MNYYSYYTEIEEHFVKRRKKNLLISPLDWALIQTWKEMGIPLHVVLRGIDQSFDQFEARAKRKRLINSLCYCQQAVQECFAAYTESRVGGGAEDAQTKESSSWVALDEVESLLERFSHEFYEAHSRANAQGMTELAEGFTRGLLRLTDLRSSLPAEGDPDTDAIEKDLSILEEWITEEIRKQVDPDTQKEWNRDAKKELRPYKKRLPPEMYQKILQNYLRKRARQEFELSPISLFFA